MALPLTIATGKDFVPLLNAFYTFISLASRLKAYQSCGDMRHVDVLDN